MYNICIHMKNRQVNAGVRVVMALLPQIPRYRGTAVCEMFVYVLKKCVIKCGNDTLHERLTKCNLIEPIKLL